MKITVQNIATDINARNVAYKHYIEVADIYQDHNKHLYDELWDRLDEYSAFYIAYRDNTPIGMGGVNEFYWKQDGVARVMDRAFQFERSNNFRGTRVTEHILKPQMDWCAENGIHTAFMSMQDPRRLSFYQKYYVDKLDYKFELQPHLYNVCRQTDYINCEETCWQAITVCYLTDNRSFILPHR